MKKQCTLFVLATALIGLQHASAQSWNLTGNSNATTSSKLGTTNSIPLRLFTNNAERVRVTEAGRVGVGITTPINILTVKASGGTPASSWTNVSTQIFYGFSEDANGEFNIGTATDDATHRSLIQGKRARGTLASPKAVKVDDYLASIVGSGFDGSNFQNPCEVDFYADGAPSSGHVPGRISFVTGTSIGDRLERLKIGSTGNISINNNQLYVQQSTGNVGIGTTSPSYKLFVNAGSTSGIYANTSGSYGVVGISSNSSGYGTYGSGGYIGAYANGGTYGSYANGGTYGTYSYGGTYGVYGASSTSATSSYGVNGSGYRGVNGTGTYGVYGTGTSYGVYGDGGGNYGVFGTSTYLGAYGYAPSGSYGTYGYSNYIGAYGFGTNYGVYGVGNTSTSGSYGVYGTGYNGVYGSGNYGVYATSSTSAGDGVHSNVSGSSNYAVNAYSASSIAVYASTGNSSSNYAGYFVGNVYCSGTYLGSDAKLKKNIKSVDNAMDIINQLQPKNYEYRSDGNFAKMNLPAGKHFGFIAQDLEKVLPNLVKQSEFNTAKSGADAVAAAALTPDKDGKPVKPAALQPVKEVKGEVIDFKAVNYTEIIPILVKGMQEQDKVIKEKDTKIDDLQLLVEKLQSSLNNIQNLLLTKGLVSAGELGTLTGGSSSVQARLDQNMPNPADGSTTLRYYLPATTGKAAIQITSASGAVLKSIQLSQTGNGQVTLNARDYPAGTYFYTLYVDGKISDSKKMVLNR